MNYYFVSHGRDARRNNSLSFLEARSAYRPDPVGPDAFDCMGRILGWPLVIAIAVWLVGLIVYHTFHH